MKRLLIWGLVLGVVVVFGGNFYYAHVVEKQLDQMTQTLNMMGGNLEHGGASVSLGGDVQIKDLLLYAPGMGEQLAIDRVVLRTGSVVGVHMLAADFRSKRLPAQLGLSIEGMRLPIGGENYRQLDLLSAQAGQSLSAAGCGDRMHFNARDVINMGYSELVMDNHVDYRLLDNGAVMEINGRTVSHGMHAISTDISLAVGATSQDFERVAMAMAGAGLQRMTIDYQDLGYAEQVLAFCEEETGLNREELIAQHLSAWQDAWQDNGFVAGPNLVSVYQRFLNKPEHLGVSVSPTSSFGVMQLATIPPELLIYQLRAELWLDRAAAGRLDLTVTDEQAAAERRARAPSQEQLVQEYAVQEAVVVEATAPVAAPAMAEAEESNRKLTIQELRNRKGSTVELRLANGRRLVGRIQQVEKDFLRLQQFQSGGHFVAPVAFSDIKEAYLRPQ